MGGQSRCSGAETGIQPQAAAAWDKTDQAIQPAPSRVKTIYTKYAAAAAILILLTAGGAWWLQTRSSLKKHELAANDGKIKKPGVTLINQW